MYSSGSIACLIYGLYKIVEPKTTGKVFEQS